MYRFMHANPQVQENEREIPVPKKVHQNGEQSVYKRRVDFYSIVGQRNRIQGWNLSLVKTGNRQVVDLQYVVVCNVFRQPSQCL